MSHEGAMNKSKNSRNGLNFSWLLKVRWTSIVGQVTTVVVVTQLLRVALPVGPLCAVIGLELLSNIIAALWFRKQSDVHEWHLAAVMGLDVAMLTGLLFFTGGPSNPFTVLYLVNIALAAVVLHAQWSWMLVGLTLLNFGLLPVLDYWPLPLGPESSDSWVTLRQQGQWVAFGVAAAFIVHFLWRVTGDLTRREQELSEARQQATRQQQMASLATMAAGAAHELATPLGTIALIAKELERLEPGLDPGALEDIVLIREQVGRCRGILDQMAGSAGKSGEDRIESVFVKELLSEALTGVRKSPPIHRSIATAAEHASIAVPPRALSQALRNVLTNAQDASPGVPVSLRADIDGGQLAIVITDHGDGMPAEVLDRCADPFFTTKAPGKGMGLGLFLTRSVVEGLAGEFAIESTQSVGTRVRVSIPLKPKPTTEHPSAGH